MSSSDGSLDGHRDRMSDAAISSGDKPQPSPSMPLASDGAPSRPLPGNVLVSSPCATVASEPAGLVAVPDADAGGGVSPNAGGVELPMAMPESRARPGIGADPPMSLPPTDDVPFGDDVPSGGVDPFGDDVPLSEGTPLSEAAPMAETAPMGDDDVTLPKIAPSVRPSMAGGPAGAGIVGPALGTEGPE